MPITTGSMPSALQGAGAALAVEPQAQKPKAGGSAGKSAYGERDMPERHRKEKSRGGPLLAHPAVEPGAFAGAGPTAFA